jgi:hypothetical protein
VTDRILTDSLLEFGEIGWAQGIGFGNDWDEIDARAKSLHDFNVQRLKGMSSGSDEV